MTRSRPRRLTFIGLFVFAISGFIIIVKSGVFENTEGHLHYDYDAYKDAPELSTILRASRSSITAEDSAVEKTLLVNPKCSVRIILEHIRKKCRLGCFTNFDLCDETGVLMGLFNLATYAYATELFEHKKTYYLVVIKTESDKRISVLPQLNRDNKLYQIFKERCKKQLLTGSPPNDVTSTSLITSSGAKAAVATKKK